MDVLVLGGSSGLVLVGGGGHTSDVLSVVDSLDCSAELLTLINVADGRWQGPERLHGPNVAVIEHCATLAPCVPTTGDLAWRRPISERSQRGRRPL